MYVRSLMFHMRYGTYVVFHKSLSEQINNHRYILGVVSNS